MMSYDVRYSRGWDAPQTHSPQSAQPSGATPTLTDLVNQYSAFNKMLMDRMNQMVVDALNPVVTQKPATQPKFHREECSCPRCEEDACHCRCCIGDADLVVYARPGETRIVPIRLENKRRRERPVNLSISDWSTHSGRKIAIRSEIQPATEFTLEACGDKDLTIRIFTAEAEQEVNDCLVVYADLRVDGLGIRPVRIALALLPLDCHPYVIDGSCSCCDN